MDIKNNLAVELITDAVHKGIYNGLEQLSKLADAQKQSVNTDPEFVQNILIVSVLLYLNQVLPVDLLGNNIEEKQENG